MNKYSADWFLYNLKNNDISRWALSRAGLYLLAIRKELNKPYKSDLPFKINHWKDLEFFEATESWHNKNKFLSNAQEKLDNGAICLTLVQNQQLAFIEWSGTQSKKSTFGGVDQTVFYPSDTSTLFSAYVHPNHRGKRLFIEGMNFFTNYVFSDTDSKIIIAAVESNNSPAMKSHLASGFEVIARFDTTRYLGKKKFYMMELSSRYKLRSSDSQAAWRLEIIE